MNCKYCNQPCIKKGLRNGLQQFYCKHCRKYQRATYIRRSLSTAEQDCLVKLIRKGVSIRGIGYILTISASSVVRYIRRISAAIAKPNHAEYRQVYEVDEMQTYIGSKREVNRVYIMYCINKATREVISFIVGRRTKEYLNKLVNAVLELSPKRICTDGLNTYRSIISPLLHSVIQYGTNRIERKNLTLRTDLKRLSRRTICFSRSLPMLVACLRIYFWG